MMKLKIKKKHNDYHLKFEIPKKNELVIKNKLKFKICNIVQRQCKVLDKKVYCEQLTKQEAREIARLIIKNIERRGYDVEISGDSVDKT